MRIKKKYRLLCACLACIVLLVGAGVVAYHGEWWYPILRELRQYESVELTEIELGADTEAWTLTELAEREDVTVSYSLMLVNAAHPLPEGYLPALIEYNGAQMHPLMKEPYIALRDDVQAKTGVRIYVASDFRTAEEQAEILASSESGIAADIGCSEHEAGLALDVYAPYCGGEQFLRSPAGRLVNDICGEYGYILRYPFGSEEITGISYEPWHIRYVGQPHARIIMNNRLTMEEYIEMLVPEVWYETDGYRICRTAKDSVELPSGWSACEISPDNTGYTIITLHMD